MITVKSRVKKIKVSVRHVKAVVQKMLDAAGYSDFDLGIWLTTDKTIRVYNKKYRKKDKPTDILSFPYHDTLKPGQKITAHDPDDKNLGDIIISLEHAKHDAKAQKHSLEAHLHVLLAHGIAHLLGYDHATDEAHRAMQKKEQQLLAAL